MPKSKKKVKPANTKIDYLRTPKGMRDVLPDEQPWWDRIRKVVRDIADFYGFGRIETPTLEFAPLYARAIGEETDIVQKEMYHVRTKSGDILALRPEGTTPVVRAYLMHHLGRLREPQRLFYESHMFRHESPQAGRFREHVQVGFEIIGEPNDPVYDAQVMTLFQHLLDELKIKQTVLKVNSIGCRVCRPVYKRQLQTYYKRYKRELCADCAVRLKINPLRLLDCKAPECQEFKTASPSILDKLCVPCCAHFKELLECLDEVKIPYLLESTLVRGLDYYNRTVFEFSVEGSDVGTLPGGGRYDYLAEFLGGKGTPGVGGACGVERLIAVMKAQEVKIPLRQGPRVFAVHVGDRAKKKTFALIEDLRRAGIPVAEALGRESLKAQLRLADRAGTSLALILGQQEIFEGNVIIRDLTRGLQETVPIGTLVTELKKRL